MKDRVQLIRELKRVKEELLCLKHLQGRHNQMSHGRGGGGGGASAEGGSEGRASSDGNGSKFNADEWAKKDDPRGEWENMPIRRRDRLADAANTVPDRQEELLKGLPPRPNTGDVAADVSKRTSQLQDRVGVEELKMLEATGKQYNEVLTKAGVKPELAHKMTMEAVDALAAQDVEAQGRTLGDHGIRHIKGDIDVALNILDNRPGGGDPTDAATAMTAMIYHDTGYMTPPSQHFLDEGHPRWSAEHYDANVRPLVSEALGSRRAGEVNHIIRTHDAADLDWQSDPVASACRVGDNMALFRKEKLPACFKQVPENVGVLKDFAAKKLTVKQAQASMKKNIAASDLPLKIKDRLNRGAEEVNKYTPKFTLGMLGGEIAGIGWKGNHVSVRLRESPSVTELNKLGDFGQRQFGKWAETYGYPKDYFTRSLKFEMKNRIGETVLESEVERIKRALMMMIKAVEKMARSKNRLKHLQGRHNQMSHGRGGRRSGRAGSNRKPGKEDSLSSSYGTFEDVPDDFDQALNGVNTQHDADLVAREYRLPMTKASRYRDDKEKAEALRMGLRGAKQCRDAIEGDPLYADAHLEPEKITMMNVNKIGGGRYANYAGEYHQKSDSAEIAASGNVMKSDRFNKSMALIPGEHNIDISVEGTVRHEIGHHVHYDLSDRYGNPSKQAAWKEFKQWADKKIDSADMDGSDSPGRISRYAMTNSREAFAEAFCMYTHPRFDRTNQGNNESPVLPPTAFKIMQRIMKGERRTFSLAD